MIHSFATYQFLFTTLAYYAKNKNLFDKMLSKTYTTSKDETQTTATRKTTTSRTVGQEARIMKTAEEELFGYSDSDVSDDTDNDTSNARPLSDTCVYVYDDEPPIVESSSETYTNL